MRPAYEDLGELTDGLPPKERAAVVLRYGYDLTYDEIAAALDSSPRRALGGVGRRTSPAKEQPMTVPTELDTRFREAAAPARPSTRDTTSSTPRSGPFSSRRPTAASSASTSTPSRSGSSRISPAQRGRGFSVPRARSTRCDASWTSTSRVVDARSISRSTSAGSAVHTGRARTARARALRAHRDIRRARRSRRPAQGSPRGRDGDESQPCRSCFRATVSLVCRATSSATAAASSARSSCCAWKEHCCRPRAVNLHQWRFVIPAADSPRPRR